jgi:hypothetical protein
VTMALYDLLVQALKESPKLEGVTPADIAELPDPLRESLRETLRVGRISFSKMADDIGLDRDQASLVVDLLIDKGFMSVVREDLEGETLYHINLARRKGRDVPTDIWKSITGPSDDKKS